jgi:cyanophycin synthetase
MIIQEVLDRGWKAWAYVLNDSHALLERPDGTRLPIYSSCPPTTSYEAAHIADDKFLTHAALEDANLPVLQTFRCTTRQQAESAAQALLEAGKQYVVKTLDAGHGHGITVRLHSKDQLSEAFAYAQQYSQTVLVQQYQDSPIDLRMLCINYKVVAVLERIPARIVGDGMHTIQERIEQQNQLRGAQYTADLSVIPLNRATQYLGSAIHAIPPEGEIVPVLGLANIGLGGEGRDLTHEVPQWLNDTAEHAARTLRLPVCGVDFLISEVPTPQSIQEQLTLSITEVNKCPSLFIHQPPTHGSAQPVIKQYVDYLATL